MSRLSVLTEATSLLIHNILTIACITAIMLLLATVAVIDASLHGF
jgi:hypothetical protein